MQILRALSRNQWLLIVTVFLAVAGVGQVWLVQLSSYRLWAFVGPHDIAVYHEQWWHSIWFVVIAPASRSLLRTWYRFINTGIRGVQGGANHLP